MNVAWTAVVHLPLLHGSGAAAWDELLLLLFPPLVLAVALLGRWLWRQGEDGPSDHDEPV